MKHIALSFLLAIALPFVSHADEPTAPKQPQPFVETFRQRALAYLKSDHPEVKSDQLKLYQMHYGYQSSVAPRMPGPFDEFVSVIFLDPSSRKESPRPGGGKDATVHFITVNIGFAPTESITLGPDGYMSN